MFPMALVFLILSMRATRTKKGYLYLEKKERANFAGADPHRFPRFYRNRSDFL